MKLKIISNLRKVNGQYEGKIKLEHWQSIFEQYSDFDFNIGGESEIEKIESYHEAACKYICENQEDILQSILCSVFENYSDWQVQYGYDDLSPDERAEYMPDIQEKDEIIPLISPKCIMILDVENDDAAYYGVQFDCTWDEEHNLGVMLHKNRVVDIGGEDSAFLSWIAVKDCKKHQTKDFITLYSQIAEKDSEDNQAEDKHSFEGKTYSQSGLFATYRNLQNGDGTADVLETNVFDLKRTGGQYTGRLKLIHWKHAYMAYLPINLTFDLNIGGNKYIEEIKPYHINTLKYLCENDTDILKLIVHSVYESYSDWEAEYGFVNMTPKKRAKYMPKIESVGEIRMLLNPERFIILDVEKEGMAYYVAQFSCSWDKNDLGVVLHKNRILAMGTNEKTLLSWIEREKQKKIRENISEDVMKRCVLHLKKIDGQFTGKLKLDYWQWEFLGRAPHDLIIENKDNSDTIKSNHVNAIEYLCENDAEILENIITKIYENYKYLQKKCGYVTHPSGKLYQVLRDIPQKEYLWKMTRPKRIVILDKAKDELAYTVAEFQFSNLEETIVQILLHGDRIVAIGTEDMADLIEIAEEDCRKGPLPDIKLVKDVKNEVKESTGLFHFLRKKFR